MVLGGHGDTMVPLISYTTVPAFPWRGCSTGKFDAIVQRTRAGGAEVVGYLKTGSAYYGPSAAVAQMVESIVLDKRRVLPGAAWLEEAYGLRGVYCGVRASSGQGAGANHRG